MIKIFTIILTSSLLFGCAKKLPKVDLSGKFTASFLGVANFGKVIVGQSRTTRIKISNDTDSVQTTPNMNPICENNDIGQCPFTQLSNDCPATIPPGAYCLSTIKFFPLSVGIFSQKIDPSGFNLNLSGQGAVFGLLKIVDDSTWEITSKLDSNNQVSPIVAGDIIRREFLLMNSGESSILAPTISNQDTFFKESSTCEEYIRPGSSCSMTVIFKRTKAMESTELLKFVSTPDNIATVNVHSIVSPASPDGTIVFSVDEKSMLADGSATKTINIDKVPDMYGNAIVTPMSLNLILSKATRVSSLPITTISGRASFVIKSDLQTSNPKLPIIVNTSIGNAFGQLIIRPLSGKPAQIIIKPFLDTIIANGNSSVTIQTEPILDSNGGIIEDQTNIYFIHSGVGTGAGTFDVGVSKTFQGVAHVKLTAPTVTNPGFEYIRVVYKDELGNITVDSGPQIINYVAGPLAGNTFPITLSDQVIYYKKDNTGLKKDFSTVTAGPFQDAFGNNVGAGYAADVSVYNGWIKNTQGLSTERLYTNNQSLIQFDVEANGFIGDINVEILASIGFNTKSIHSSSDHKIKYEKDYLKNGERLKIFKTYSAKSFRPDDSPLDVIPNDQDLTSLTSPLSPGKNWNRLYKVGAITDIDEDLLGQTTYASDVVNETNFVFPKILGLNCIQNIKEYTALFPCFFNKKFDEIQAPPYGASTWGNSGFFALGKDGLNSIIQSSPINYPYQLGNPSNHGTYSTIFPTQLYIEESDNFYTYGGLQFNTSGSTYTIVHNNVSSVYKNAVGVNSSLDELTYSKESLISHKGLFLSSSTESARQGKFIYSGFKTPTSQQPAYTIDNTISRVFHNQETGEDSFEEVVVNPDINGFKPEPKILSGFYYDDSSDDVYIIGGLRKSSSTYVFDDTIWKFNFKSVVRRWERVCDNCGLPQELVSLNFSALLNFPLWNTADIAGNFTEIQKYVHNTYVFRSDDGNIYMIYDNSTTGNEGWILDLSSSSLSRTVLAGNEIKSFSRNKMPMYNRYSGRLYGFKSGADTSETSRIDFFETKINTKQYYLAQFFLDSDAKNNVIRLSFNVSAFAKESLGSSEMISFYAFDFNAKKYQQIGSSSNRDSLSTKITPSVLNIEADSNPSRFVSSSGSVYLLLTSGESYSTETTTENQSTLRINSISLEGIW